MPILRRTFLASAAGASVWMAESCSRRTAAAPPAKVQVSNRPFLYMAPFELARESGYFKDEGLDLGLQSVEDANQSIALLAGGKLDVAFATVTASMINAVLKGAGVRVVAGRRRLVPGCSDSGTLYGNRETFPNGLADLATLKRELPGKRISINSRASGGEFYLDTMLNKAGLSLKDVRVVLARFPEAVAGVISKQLDAFHGAEQFSAQPISDSPKLVRGMGMGEILPNFQYSMVLFGQNLLQADPAIGARFLRAYLRGMREFVEGKTPAFMDEFARKNGYDVERARSSCRRNETLDGAIDRESVRLQADWFAQKGYCPMPASVEQLVDSRFLELAHAGKS